MSRRAERRARRTEGKEPGHRSLRGVGAGVACLAALALGACEPAGDARDVERVQRRDSAGARIVESTVPRWREGEGWTVDPEPALVVGAVDGPETEVFGLVVDALRLPDGGVAVADNQAAAVRLFGPDGRHRVTLGGPGEGPGELGFLSALWRRGADTLVAYDRAGSQLEHYALLDGAFLTGRRVHSTGAVLGLAHDGTPMTLVFFDDLSTLSGVTEPLYGVVLGYEPGDTLTTLSGGQQYWREVGGRNVRGLIPFGRDFTSAGRWGRLAAGAGLREIVVLDPGDEAPMLRVRWAAARKPVDGNDLDAFFEAMAEEAPEAAERARRDLDRVAVPDSMPVHGALALGPEGTLWVERYAPEWEASGTWDVFDPGGAWLGPVDLPPDLRVLEVGTDWVLGVARDALDVPRVRLHTVRRR